MAGRPMTMGAKPSLRVHAFEQNGFQAARSGLGDEHAIGDSDPGRLRLAWREIEDDETFFRVASDLQFGLERYGFLLLPGNRKFEEGVARHCRGRDYLGSRPQLGVCVEKNFVKPVVTLAVVPRKHELDIPSDEAVAVPFRPKLNRDRIAQVLGLIFTLGVQKTAFAIHAFKNASRSAAGVTARS